MPVPDVHEGGESTWEAWQEESRRMDLAFAETQPSDVIPLTADPRAAPPVQRRGAHWSADDLLVLARRNNRVCPRPFLWSALYVLLEGDRYADLRPPPVRAWEWAALSNLQRRLHLHETIQWADRHAKLDVMGPFLASLTEPDWVHMGED
ncbi:hypothetical protein HK414_06200 [Ramlibacter terrae]|uniref:Uncharacterized protein n=1 Tax=Ramlibacter terrae TaxID=2732511 RepID=A0ABX6P3P9_9BURK|nr:hypothetical protein HK414_06200 [Ramlibacter terrae]